DTPLAQSLRALRNWSALTGTAPLAATDRAAELTPKAAGACSMGPMQRIESIFIAGPAGRLECFLKHPAAPEAGRAGGPGTAAVVCHPHPLFGGTMHNKV